MLRFLLISCLFGFANQALADDWPQFRGPAQNGISTETIEFVGPPKIAWKTALPGHGWSQPVVVDGTIYVTTAVADSPLHPTSLTAGPPPGQRPSRDKPPVPDVTIEWRVLALDAGSGSIKWSRGVVAGKPQEPVHPSNTFATETPAADGKAVYVYFGMTGTVAALDPSGNELWRRELSAGPVDQGHGTASSLALDGDRLYVPCFRDDIARLICLDAATGAVRWEVTRPKPATSWSTPLVWKNRLRSEVVMGAGKLTTSHDPQSGEEFWRIERIDAPHKASPVGTAESLFFGYRLLNGPGILYSLDAGATGDHSPSPGEKKLRAERWSQAAAAPALASPIVVEGLVYSIGGNIACCLDASTGELRFRQRLPDMNTVAASPVAIGNQVIVVDEDGRGLIIKADSSLEVVTTFNLDEMVWASPAVAGGRLFVRGAEHLYCLQP